MKAHLTQVRISPKKVNLVASMIRGMSVAKALQTLKFTDKKAADILYKLVASAKANAENNFKQDASKLIIEEVLVGDGTTYKRRQPISRGRAHPILKRTSHVTVKFGISEEVKPEKIIKAVKPKKVASQTTN